MAVLDGRGTIVPMSTRSLIVGVVAAALLAPAPAPAVAAQPLPPVKAKAYANRVIAPHLRREAEKYAMTRSLRAGHCWNAAGSAFCRMSYKGTLFEGATAWCVTFVSIQVVDRRRTWKDHDSTCWTAGSDPMRYWAVAGLGTALRTLVRMLSG